MASRVHVRVHQGWDGLYHIWIDGSWKGSTLTKWGARRLARKIILELKHPLYDSCGRYDTEYWVET